MCPIRRIRRNDICLYLAPADRAEIQTLLTDRNAARKLVWRAEIVLRRRTRERCPPESVAGSRSCRPERPARGRDAADVPLTQTFGQNTLTDFKVRTDELARPWFPLQRTIVNQVASTHIPSTDAKYPGPAWMRNMAPANQRIDDMSFKDLIARAAAAMKPKPAETSKNPANEKEPKADGKEATPKSKKS